MVTVCEMLHKVLLFSGSTIPVLRSLLVTVCEVLLQSTRELPSPQELKDSQDGQDKSFLNTDHRLKVCIELEFSSTNFEPGKPINGFFC